MSDERLMQIHKAIIELSIQNSFIEIYDSTIIEEIKNIFIESNPRVWWLSFKHPSITIEAEDEKEYLELSKHFNLDEYCFFIAELDVLHIFKGRIKDIMNVLGECSFFEYYVVNEEMSKLVCETDHGDLLKVETP